MSGQTYEYNIKVTDKGASLSSANTQAEALVSNLNAAESASKKLEKASKGVAAAKAENKDYNASRGVAGGTGAGARDFAKEAHGLGGLVRLYATYAANVFAVSAAFRALSDAANVDNMIRGMDQLGAASGVALGSLAKQFAAATGGAVSLKDSISAVTKASTAGLNSKQILQIADVSKKASQALGISVTDAVSRLSRGITKLEPELLDELSIFTKLGPATEEYAAKLGKPVSALTQFERIQAFANATLTEGNKKFGEIDVPTNPYDKLLASLNNIATSALSLVNTALTPLVSILSASPVALSAVLTGIGAMIIKQAIPAIGEYRAGLRKAADEAREMAEDKAKLATASLRKVQEARNKEVLLEKEKYAALADMEVDAAEKRLQGVSKKGLSKNVKKILSKEYILDIDDKDLAVLDKLGAKQTQAAARYRELAAAVRQAKAANTEYLIEEKRLEEQLNKAPGKFTAAGIAQAKAESMRKSAASKSIISQAGEDAGIEGFSAALSNMNKSVKESNLGKLGGMFTRVAGFANVLMTSITGILSVFTRFLGWIGVAITGFQLLDSWLSKSSESVEAMNASFEKLKDSGKNATNVFEKFGNTLSVEGIIAKSRALDDLTVSFDSALDGFLTAQKDIQSSKWDSALDWLWDQVGRGSKDKFAEVTAKTVQDGLKVISDPAQKKEAEAKIKELLKIDALDNDAIEKGVGKASESTLKALQKLLASIAKESHKMAAPVDKAAEGFKSLEKSYLDLSNALLNNDPLSKYAVELISQVNNLNEVFNNPLTKAAELKEILKDTSLIRPFSADAQKAILDAARGYEDLLGEVEKYKKEQAAAQVKLGMAEANKSLGLLSEGDYMTIKVEGSRELEEASRKLSSATENLKLRDQAAVQALKSETLRGIQALEAPLTRAIAQSTINAQKQLLSGLPKSIQSVEIMASLEKDALELRRQEIVALYELVKSTDLKRLQDQKFNLEQKKREFQSTGDIKAASELNKPINDIEEAMRVYTDKTYKPGAQTMGTEAAGILAKRIGLDTKLATLAGESKLIDIKTITEKIDASFVEQKNKLEADLKLLLEKNRAEELRLSGAPQAEQVAARQARAEAEQKKRNEIENLGLSQSKATVLAIEAEAGKSGDKRSREIVAEAKSANALLDTRIKQQTELQNLNLANKGVEDDRALTAATTRTYLEAQKDSRNKELALVELSAQKESNILEMTQKQLDLDMELNRITKDQYATSSYGVAVRSAELEAEKAKKQIANELQTKYDEIYQTASEKGAENSEDAERERQRAYDAATQRLALIDEEFRKKKELAEFEKTSRTTLADLEKQYSAAFAKSIDSMTDAFLEFAKTGKLSFKDLANSLIADLARIAIRAQMVRLMDNLFGTGWANTAGQGTAGMFSSSNGWASTGIGRTLDTNSAFEADWAAATKGLVSAKGNVFDAGLQKFAQGGAFTNSIVSSPTLFRFAHGTGLMGEAGPEAIMPLKRDSNGNLGVRTNQQAPQTSVVVNNYGSEKATTKETTDSNGNRKIEVVIGDMVAGEMAKPGSNLQRSMQTTFNTRPAMTRR